MPIDASESTFSSLSSSSCVRCCTAGYSLSRYSCSCCWLCFTSSGLFRCACVLIRVSCSALVSSSRCASSSRSFSVFVIIFSSCSVLFCFSATVRSLLSWSSSSTGAIVCGLGTGGGSGCGWAGCEVGSDCSGVGSGVAGSAVGSGVGAGGACCVVAAGV